jgi:UTP-glucose-1-phosphate uridylyltransferase
MIGGQSAFHGFRFEGRRFDCGDKVGFLEATIDYALARPDLAGEVRRILQDASQAAEPAAEAPPRQRRQRS